MPEPVDQILLRFPGPVTFYASRKKWGLALLFSIGTVVMSAFFLRFDEFPTRSQLIMPWPFFRGIFWLGVVFFGFGILISVVAMLPGGSKLSLDRGGFEITKFFRARRIDWRDASGFQVWFPPLPSSSRSAVVMFDNVRQPNTTYNSLNISLTGHNDGMPDTYGFSADDLARLMSEWRERALR